MYRLRRTLAYVRKTTGLLRHDMELPHGLLSITIGTAVVAMSVWMIGYSDIFATEYLSDVAGKPERFIPLPEFDKMDYNARMLALAHVVLSTTTASSTEETIPFSTATTSVAITGRLWPKSAVYPKAGALLPFKRIVAYYGNFYSKQMGVLGEYPEDVMLAKLASTTAIWAAADPSTPAIPAIQYIAVVAQAAAGKDGKYIARMPDDQIDRALEMANKLGGIVILDVQVGQSTLQHELPLLEKYLAMRQVHLAIDPEFSMKFGDAPGRAIGTFDAADINYAAQYLAYLVREHHLPPKVLVVHRFTQKMVTNYQNILPLQEVEIVMDMDGFGSKDLKYGTYTRVVAPEPVQFTGIKLFYKNDARTASGMLSPAEVLALTPVPVYIQYQ